MAKKAKMANQGNKQRFDDHDGFDDIYYSTKKHKKQRAASKADKMDRRLSLIEQLS